MVMVDPVDLPEGVIDQFKGRPIKGRHAYESLASAGSLIN